MNPGLRMALMSDNKRERPYPMENRKIGFGEEGDYARYNRMNPKSRPMRNDDDEEEREMRNYSIESRRQPRDDRGRYTTRRRSEYSEGDVVPYPKPYAPNSNERHGESEPRREYNLRSEYDRRNEYDRPRSHEENNQREEREIRAGGTFWMEPTGGGMKKLTREKADKWVKHMESDDPKAPRGGVFTYEDAKRLAADRDIPTEGQDLIDFYAALNMMYSDYSKVAHEYGVDNDDYYADLACAFLYDRDGKRPSEKLASYYMYVVPKDEEE